MQRSAKGKSRKGRQNSLVLYGTDRLGTFSPTDVSVGFLLSSGRADYQGKAFGARPFAHRRHLVFCMSTTGPSLKPARIPRATYRLQFNRQFTFQQATELADYLADLGISDCYASPLFRAGPQSSHGYDICAFDQFNPNLGSAEDFDRFAARLRQLGLGLLLDMVPNHMGNDLSNCWWLDVLEQGPSSRYASWFDIDWRPLQSDLRDQVLLPILEDCYASVLEAGKLRLGFEDGSFFLAYYDRKFPISARSHTRLFQALLTSPASGSEPDRLEPPEPALAEAGPAIQARAKHGQAPLRTRTRVSAEKPTGEDGGREYLTELLELSERLAAGAAAGRLGASDHADLKSRLKRWHEEWPAFRIGMAELLTQFNGQPGAPRSFDLLDALIRQQHYRLAFWRVGPEEINYRRFFDVTELVSVRMEVPEVFRATHQLVFALLAQDKITGLRIDHPDGLWDPKAYFDRLQAERQARPEQAQPAATASQGTRPALYIVAEKILTRDEPLPVDWPIAGTTGYDFLNRVNGLFVERQARDAFDRLYRDFTGRSTDFAALVRASKKRVLHTSLISELNALAHRLKQIAVGTRYGQDFTLRQLHAALVEVIAAFPVYRTYVTPATAALDPNQSEYVREALARARALAPALDSRLFDFLEQLLLLTPPYDFDETRRNRCREFVMRFQQLTGPVMAKGLEDTALYNFNRLISLNEVGGDPDAFGIDPDTFHRCNLSQAVHWPHSLLATATHDTKRGEDVRARLNVLSEMAEEWRAAVLRWAAINAPQKTFVEGQPAPHPNDEYLLYQTLVGAWPEGPQNSGADTSPSPEFRERIAAYLLKAIREAKAHTSWTNPNARYEEAIRLFAERILTPHDGCSSFLADFRRVQEKVAYFGQFNSLSQVLLKLTAPGVPDFYQGTELWDFNLVDPDNRRPVDYAARRQLLADVKARANCSDPDYPAFLRGLRDRSQTGQIKLYLIWRVLQFRQAHPELFDQGRYVPLYALGGKREHLCAFARHGEGHSVMAIAPRLVLRLAGSQRLPPLGSAVWQDTFLPVRDARQDQAYRNVLTREIVRVHPGEPGLRLSEVLHCFPVALLGPGPK